LGLKAIAVGEYHEYSRTLQEQIDALEVSEANLEQDISDLEIEKTSITTQAQ
jgi:hypothetical protein